MGIHVGSSDSSEELRDSDLSVLVLVPKLLFGAEFRSSGL